MVIVSCLVLGGMGRGEIGLLFVSYGVRVAEGPCFGELFLGLKGTVRISCGWMGDCYAPPRSSPLEI